MRCEGILAGRFRLARWRGRPSVPGMSGPEVLMELRAVRKAYGGSGGAGRLEILRDANLTLGRGESVAIVGPSGSGKTTVLNLMGTLDRPDSGQVLLEGRDLATLDEQALAGVRNQVIGFVFQFHHLLPHLTLLENVLVPTLACPDREERRGAVERARRLLARVGLEGRHGHRPAALSGGERQRGAVVRALIRRPKLLLADEPTGALDARSARELGMLLRELNREEGVTLVLVTHALDLAREMGRVYEVRDGGLALAAGEGQGRAAC